MRDRVARTVAHEPAGPAPILVVEHEEWAGLGRLAPALAVAVPGRVDVVRPYLGDELPCAASAFAGVVVLGGSMSAGDDVAAPWLPATRRLLRDAVDFSVPVLGICLGAQLLAMATGGRVARAGAGPEIGPREVRLLPAAAGDALLHTAAADGSRLRVLQWHCDSITDLPRDAVALATGEHYVHQAFRLGTAAWGVQFHPEVTLGDFARWLVDGGEDLRAAGLDRHALLAGARAVDDDLARLARRIGSAFADVVRGHAHRAVSVPQAGVP